MEKNLESKNFPTQKYKFLEEFKADPILNVLTPFGTTQKEIENIFVAYKPSRISERKGTPYFYVYFNENIAAANHALKDLQYHPINESFLVLSKYSEINYLNPKTRLSIEKKNFDHIKNKNSIPRKLQRYFENAGKVVNIRLCVNNYFVQFYLEEDRDNAYQLVKDKEFEGKSLIIEFPTKEHKNFTESSKQIIQSKKEPEELSKSDCLNSDEERFEQKDEINYENKFEQIQINDEANEKKNSSNIVLDEEIIHKIVTKLVKQLGKIISDEKILEMIRKKLSNLDRKILLNYLIDEDDNWFINFFLEITK